ncbi:KPN_02809 family neutral zinc metallopeptidase [Acetoanaerobium noterae]|uniref:KPN_02809 family neutral zinc metallopeptidase n=1 Tax=Acetoanaerobium noterae TaxID=745369 RepID=UPI001B6F41F6|nr:neutral zinc metallopeptidase [Acetoanaerobium noterae]MBP8763688.1 neutral zinc metallopeptidase [Acetoanaerobium sp.]
MKWKGRAKSSNVEDRRGRGVGGAAIGGLGGFGIIIMIIYALLGGNPGDIMQSIDPGQTQNVPYEATQEEEELAEFVSVVLADTEVVWNDIFADLGKEYNEPKLVLFTGSVQSACGVAGASTGPFYCPGDKNVYIDLSFYNELKTQFKAPGDFAMAYVIAHEVGHHIQNELGIIAQMDEIRGKVSKEEYNKYNVRLELQADYLAGVWANHVQGQNLLEEGDLEEALTAASAVGDDRIQMQSQGYVVPDSFTHGTSEQRKRWFYKGYEAGDLSQWDTFSANEL